MLEDFHNTVSMPLGLSFSDIIAHETCSGVTGAKLEEPIISASKYRP